MSKKLNTYTKGKRTESLAKKKLIEMGYLVDKKNYARFASKDFFGHFDLIAIRGNIVRLIQVKSVRSHAYQAIREIQEWKLQTGITLRTEVWTYMGKGNWIMESITANKIESYAIDGKPSVV